MAQTSTAENKPSAAKRSTLLGAVFLMATSAIGPGYPSWLLIVGVVAWLLTLYLGYNSLGGIAALWK
ncbi:hypothetical protein [Saccharopolyspora pogona]|uniref:hypothetical protein n=1 Tax=Saccharopolyspora pogona TaxID=333966 RepID=UPI001681D2D1|nr:hypothetical protein [Saccharopolyspora pogona]